MFRKNPGFTLTAVFTIALGIGASTAIFSVVNSVLLKQLPYDAPDRLVTLSERDVSSPGLDNISYATARAYRERSRTLESLLEYNDSGGGRLIFNDGAEQLRGQSVSPEFFRSLGIRAELGRVFEPADALPGRSDVIILSHGIWERIFGADPAIIGRTLDINNRPTRVIGVLPADFHPFHMSNPGEVPQVFRPFPIAVLQFNDYYSGVTAIARLRPGVTLGAARAELNQICRDVAHEHGRNDPQSATVRVEPLYESMTGKIRTALWVLLGAVGFVLLIACTNVANLLLTRASGRTAEMGIRAAVGCSWWRLVRQLATESLVLSLAGGALGVLLAKPAIAALVAAAPTEIPRVDEIRIDSTALLLALAATLGSGIVFALVPALRARRVDLNEMLRGYRDAGGGRNALRMRGVLVTIQIGCAFLLAVGTGLLGRSIDQLLHVNPGYDPHRIFTMTAFAHDHDTAAEVLGYYRQLMERVRALPGVESVAMASSPPLSGGPQVLVNPEGRSVPDSPEGSPLDLVFATPGYFHVMRIALLEGRTFNDHDDLHAPAVAVISRAATRQMFGSEDPLGRRIRPAGQWPASITVIGVVEDVWQHGMDDGPSAGMYIPQAQRPDFYYRLLARTAGDPWQIYPAVRSIVHDLNPREPMFHVQPMDTYVTKSLADRIFTLSLIGSLGALALLLAAVGICGVVSYTVSLRTREIGVRMALGAGRRAVVSLVLRDLLAMLVWGLAGGLIAALALSHLLTHLLYHVHPTDTVATAAAAIVLIAVSLAAAYIPCRRAASIAPSLALHHE
jgi:putative ABC transport system permease protein